MMAMKADGKTQVGVAQTIAQGSYNCAMAKEQIMDTVELQGSQF